MSASARIGFLRTCCALSFAALSVGGCIRLGFEDLTELDRGRDAGGATSDAGAAGAGAVPDAAGAAPDAAGVDVVAPALASCVDGLQNQDETGVDCGGGSCGACPTCSDGLQNQDETGVDCGGARCAACAGCLDGVQNRDETGVDCGGASCGACPTCSDGLHNGDETGVDCGGASCGACPTCSDGLHNGDETGVDCGGASCGPCACSYGAPQVLGNPNYPGNQLWSPSPSQDRLSLYVAVVVPGFSEQIMLATRASVSDSFGFGNPLPPPVPSAVEGTPYLSSDGLSLYFYSTRSGGIGDRDLYVATRASTGSEFSSVAALTELNSSAREHLPWLSPDERAIHFSSNRGGGEADLWTATRASESDPFSPPSLVSELNTSQDEGGITLSADQRVVVFASNRTGSQGRDLYRAQRPGPGEAFSTPVLLSGLNSGSDEIDPALTEDGTELYFISNRNGEIAIWRSARTCP